MRGRAHYAPVKRADLLGEQLLTEVKPCLKRTALLEKSSIFGVLTALLPYAPIWNPPSSMNISSTFFWLAGGAALTLVLPRSSCKTIGTNRNVCEVIITLVETDLPPPRETYLYSAAEYHMIRRCGRVEACAMNSIS